MGKHRSTGAALIIMIGSGAIADFELHGCDSEFFIRIWVPQNCDACHLRKQVAALLPNHAEERHTIAE